MAKFYTVLGVLGAALAGVVSKAYAGTALITVPTSTATQLTGSVSDLFTDPGLLTLILVVAAIPFFFYVVKKLIALIPKR